MADYYKNLELAAEKYSDYALGQSGFVSGANWERNRSKWIDINDRNVTMPNNKECLLKLENGAIVRDTEEW